MTRRLKGLLLASCLLAPLAAAAQQGTPAFRVPLGDAATSSGAPPVYAWMETVSECSATCGSGTRTTDYQCQNAADFDYGGPGYGAPEADALCQASAGPKPASSSSSCSNYSACSYDWVRPTPGATPQANGSDQAGRLGCGWIHETYAPYCQRTGGGTPVVMPKGDHQFCRNDRPDYDGVANGDPDALGYDRMTKQLGSCDTSDHQWITGEWGAWSSTCSTTATHTRTPTCKRTFDSTIVADARCDVGSRPAASETQAVYSTCSYDWAGALESDWSAWSSTCSNNATRTRSVTCRRSNGDVVADQVCVDAGKGAKPASSQTQGVYSSCSYSAGGGVSYGAWSSTCSSSATRNAHSQCVRSDGTVVGDSDCASRGVGLDRQDGPTPVYSGCSYSYQTGGWSDWNSHCSNSATHTRSVSCTRSDGTAVSDGECSSRGIGRPPASETQGVYDGCGYYAGGMPSYGGWSSTCSSNATRNTHYQCVRSDGTIVGDGECTGRGVGLDQTSAPSGVYSGCGYSAGGSPSYGGWSSTCSSNAQRNVHYQCVRGDGAVVGDGECTGRGIGLDQTQTGAEYSGCRYSFSTGGWSDWNSHCSASATRTRGVTCQRSDGTPVSDSECTNRGQSRPASSATQGVYDGCGYATEPSGAWGQCSNGTQSRTLQCRRSDGALVDPSFCFGRTVETQSCTEENASWEAVRVGDCSGAALLSAASTDEAHPIDQDLMQRRCAAANGRCLRYEFSETHDYDGRQESWNESMTCYQAHDPSRPYTGGSYANANSSGSAAVLVRR